jgi:GDP-L-fucose synthase
MSKILVTGGSGLLGSALKAVAAQHTGGHELQFVDIEDGDLRERKQTEDLFRRYQPEGVIHLAADVGGLYKNVEQGVEMLHNNILMNMHVMQCCLEFRVSKLVSCLSTCVFPEASLSQHIQLPINEGMIHQGPPHPSNEGYAYAKRLVEVQSRCFRQQYGCNFISLAPTNIFGPHDNYSLANSHVIPALIRKCHAAMIENSDFVVRGSGRPLRQFIFSLDLARLFLWAYDSYSEPDCLILAPGPEHEVSVGEVATAIARIFGYDKPIVYDTSYSDGQHKRTVSAEKLRSLNPTFEFTPLYQALTISIEWYTSNFATARV